MGTPVQVVGIDGCRGGWIAVAYDTMAASLTARVHTSFGELLERYPDANVIAIDIPIGLSESGPRLCDVEARHLLHPWRSSSVFPAPHPGVLGATTFDEASTRARSLTGKGITLQTFAICPKIAEVNRAMTPQLQDRVIEVHPEVSFWALAGGRAMEHKKSRSAGFKERREHLVDALHGLAVPARLEALRLARPAKPDDVLDAIVAAWSAWRHAEGRSDRLPAVPQSDASGLKMAITY